MVRNTTERSLADIIVNGFSPEERVTTCTKSIGNYLLHCGLDYSGLDSMDSDPNVRLDRMASFLDRVAQELRAGKIPVAGDFERLADGLR